MADEGIRYVVLLRKPEQLDFPVLAAALARQRACPVLDAMSEARSCWGIIGEGQGEPSAKNTAAALNSAGIEALALPQNLLEDLPPPVPVVKADFEAGEPAFFTAGGEALPAGGATLLCAAVLKRSVTQTIKTQQNIGLADKALQVGLLMATGIPIKTSSMRKEVTKTVTSSELSGVLDIFVGKPARRLRVLSEAFDYSCLKEDKVYDTLGNLRALARRLAAAFPAAGRNRGLRFILEGRPQREMGHESAADLERESRWLLTLLTLKA
jgi:hypothetical protein